MIYDVPVWRVIWTYGPVDLPRSFVIAIKIKCVGLPDRAYVLELQNTQALLE